MHSNIISFPARPVARAAEPVPPRKGAAPVASFALLVRGTPLDLRPEAVARAMIDAGSNAAAAPIWKDARHRWTRLVISRGLRGLAVDGASDKYRAAVRDAGIAEKARRRRAADAVAAWMRAGGLHEGDADAS
jgi:hypothetical protein